jgi:hypothetical protein
MTLAIREKCFKFHRIFLLIIKPEDKLLDAPVNAAVTQVAKWA